MEAGFYGVARLGSPMGEGVTGSQQATLDGVVKTGGFAAPYQVANEYICGQLALAVGLPTPPGTIVSLDDGTAAYAMMRFGIRGDRLPPCDPAEVVNKRAKLAARVVAFDSLIVNYDRHAGNLAFDEEVGLSVFDHGHALLGVTGGKAVEHCNQQLAEPVVQGCLTPYLKNVTDLLQAANRIGSLHDDFIRETCETPRRLKLISYDERNAAISLLTTRKQSVWHNFTQAKDRFPLIEDWGLS